MRTAKKKSLFRFGTLSDLPMDMSKGWKWAFKPLVRGYAEDHTFAFYPEPLGLCESCIAPLPATSAGKEERAARRCSFARACCVRGFGKGALPALV